MLPFEAPQRALLPCYDYPTHIDSLLTNQPDAPPAKFAQASCATEEPCRDYEGCMSHHMLKIQKILATGK